MNWKLSLKPSFNGHMWVNGYADSEYDIFNNISILYIKTRLLDVCLFVAESKSRIIRKD